MHKRIPAELPLERWQAFAHREESAGSSLLTITGPSGVGKTTVAAALPKSYAVYIESTAGNPYLRSVLESKADLDAASNQAWFLERLAEYVAGADPRSPLILDQDPAAVVFAYSRMFLDEGRLAEDRYAWLTERLLTIEESLRRWRAPRETLCLDAPASVLHDRVLRRSAGGHVPPVEWFSRIRNYFLELFDQLPNAVRVSTVDLSVDEVIAQARALIIDREGA